MELLGPERAAGARTSAPDADCRQLLDLASAAAVRLHPPKGEAAVAAFEQQHDVRLPADYRWFIAELGDGGDGPTHYQGVAALGTRIEEKDEVAPGRPFPLTEYWIWENEREPDEERLGRVWSDGFVWLGTDGCGEQWVLVVSGESTGQVWSLADVGAQPWPEPPAPRGSFAAWYVHWLEHGPNWW